MKMIEETMKEIYSETVIPILKRVGLSAALLCSGASMVTGATDGEAPRQVENLQNVVTGQVVDGESGDPLPGVNIVLEGTTTGTTTNLDGEYSLRLQDLNGNLVISYIGYQAQTIPVNGRTEIDITLNQDVAFLSDVVVIGYGTQERSDLTGSISSMDTDDFQGQALTNVAQTMQGRLPGVQISYGSGEPGAPMEMQIRGIGTFGDNSPLYVIDGVPIQSEDMSGINTNDIESIQVLKDASAASIYGARAANGVVLITTHGGQVGAPVVDYTGYVGFQSFTDYRDMLNSEQYAAVNNESTAASGLPPEPAFNDPQNLQHNTDWQREAFQTAPMMNHSLRVSGGTERARYSVSGEYFGQEGIFVFNHLNRYSTRVNTEFDINDKLTIGETFSLSRTEGLNRGFGNNLDLAYLLGGSPTMRIYRPENEGGYAGPHTPETGVNNRDNIIGRRDLRRHYNDTNRLLGNAFANYEILPGLEYRLNLGLNARFDTYENFVPTYDMDNRTQQNAVRNDRKSESYEYLMENTLTYLLERDDLYTVNFLAGFTQENMTSSYLSGNIQEFPSNELQVIDAGTGSFNVGGNKAEWAIRSFLGRINATILDKYLMSVTIRRDGSSRFGSANRWGNFPSFALGWIVNEESFFPSVPEIDQLKLRASWGKLGNQEIGNYVNQTTISTSPRYVFGGAIAPAAAVTSLGNPFLKWETTTQTDIGFDLEMFGNRLVVYGDYFSKVTDDILLRTPISAASGIARTSGPFQNAASVKNSGVELQVMWREARGDFNYSLSGNIATLSNEVTSLGGESSIINWVANAYHYGTYTYTTVGQPMSSYYGWKMDGIFQNQTEINNHASQPGAEPGDVRFRDLSEDGVIDDDDRTVLGDPFPDFTYGFSGQFGYKNWDASLAISGVQGRDLYNSERAYLESLNGEHNQMATTLNRWTGEGTSTTMPRAVRQDPNDNARASDRFVEDASYLRLQSLQIGYTLPEEWISQAGMSRLRVYLNGQNLLTLTGYSGYNPDVRGGAGWSEVSRSPLSIGVDTGTYPLPRVFQLGVQASF